MIGHERNSSANIEVAQRDAISRHRHFATALATLAIGVSFAVLMPHVSALATPLACPVPDGTIVSGNDTLEEGATICVFGSTTIQAGGRLDNNNFGPTVSQDGSTLINNGALNHNSISSAAVFTFRGAVENRETGTVNVNSGPQPIIGGNFVVRGNGSEGPEFSNAGVLNNYAVTVNRGSSAGSGQVSTFDNSGSINNFAGATFINHSELINQSGGVITNDGTFNTSVGLAEGQNITSSLTNFGTIDNNNIWNNGDNSVVSSEFNNHGVLNNIGTFNTNRNLRNHSDGTINNTGIITSDTVRGGELQNLGEFVNRSGGILDLGQRLEVGGSQPGEDTGVLTNESGGVMQFRSLLNRASVVNEAGGVFEAKAGGLFSNTATGTIDNAGLFDLSPGGAAFSMFNFGDIINRSGGTFVMHAGALVTAVESSITNEAGGVLELTDPGARIFTTVDSDISNAGSIRIAAQTTISANDQFGGDFLQTGGSTVVDGVLSQRSVDIQGGSLSGSGTVEALNGQVTVGPGGSVNPGNSPGTMVINSSFECDACLIEIEIGGRNPGQFDLLEINGGASFLAGSRILFSFIDGFAPLANDIFTFLDSDGISGFGQIDFSFTGLEDGFAFDVALSQDESDLILTALTGGEPATTPVPEPAAGGLLGLSLAALGWLRRRNRRQPVTA